MQMPLANFDLNKPRQLFFTYEKLESLILTYRLLLQIRQCGHTDLRKWHREDVDIAIPIDTPTRTKQLYTRLNQAGEPQDKEYECSDDDKSRQQHSLPNKYNHQDDEDDGEAGDRDFVGK